jgi:outer membrane protein assembly factor BamB
MAPLSPFGRCGTDGVHGIVTWGWSDYLMGISPKGDEIWRLDGDFRPGLFVGVDGVTGVCIQGRFREDGMRDPEVPRRLLRVRLVDGAVEKTTPVEGQLICADDRVALLGRSTSNPETWHVQCVALDSFETQWTHATGHPAFSLSASIADGRVFTCFAGDLVALSAETGETIWRSPISDLGGHIGRKSAHFISNGVCVLSEQFWIAGFDTGTGERMWASDLWGPSVVYGDRVYVHNDGWLHALDLNDGTRCWSRHIAPEMEKRNKKRFEYSGTPLAASDTHLWFGDPHGFLWALNRDTGEPEWHHRPKGSVGFAGGVMPAISGKRLYIPTFSLDRRLLPSLYCYEQT